MSMENAILAHANALDNLANAIRAAFGGGGVSPITPAAAAHVSPVVAEAVKAGAAEDTKKARAKTDTKLAEVQPDAELDKAVEKVEAAAQAEKGAETTAGSSETGGADSSGDAAPLDYNKDVKPALLAAIKKAGKEKVQALIKTYGVDKADQIDPAQFTDLLAKAKAL
jgi:hypothetical protein